MENQDTEYSKNNRPDSVKPAAAQNESVKTPGNESFEHAQNDPNPHIGSDALSERYNINDKANHDSSVKDFVKTVSNFHHADTTHSADADSQNDTSGDSRNHS